jgi:acetyltransferase
MNVRRITSAEANLFSKLSDLLIDSVEHHASVGFILPMTEAKAQHYWREVFEALGEARAMWIAEEDGEIVGTVQLSYCMKENGTHRAEVQKLLVLSRARGQGIATELMRELEHEAKRQKRSLLVLDTETDSKAEALYSYLGWTKVGEIPGYALDAKTLVPTACSFFYKKI